MRPSRPVQQKHAQPAPSSLTSHRQAAAPLQCLPAACSSHLLSALSSVILYCQSRLTGCCVCAAAAVVWLCVCGRGEEGEATRGGGGCAVLQISALLQLNLNHPPLWHLQTRLPFPSPHLPYGHQIKVQTSFYQEKGHGPVKACWHLSRNKITAVVEPQIVFLSCSSRESKQVLTFCDLQTTL